MPKWLRRFFRGMLATAVDTAVIAGRTAGHTAIDNLGGSFTNHEKDAARQALDVALDRVHKEIMEEL